MNAPFQLGASERNGASGLLAGRGMPDSDELHKMDATGGRHYLSVGQIYPHDNRFCANATLAT